MEILIIDLCLSAAKITENVTQTLVICRYTNKLPWREMQSFCSRTPFHLNRSLSRKLRDIVSEEVKQFRIWWTRERNLIFSDKTYKAVTCDGPTGRRFWIPIIWRQEGKTYFTVGTEAKKLFTPQRKLHKRRVLGIRYEGISFFKYPTFSKIHWLLAWIINFSS